MIINHIKIILRKLFTNKSNLSINVLGLAFGLASCILIFSYINFELSFDRYHKNSNNIYRIDSKSIIDQRATESANCPLKYAPTLIEEFPEVIDAVRFVRTVERSFSYNDLHYFQDGVIYTDQDVFNVFSFNLISGDPKTALKYPYTMVLTEETAKKYFGDENPLGKMIKWDNSANYTVTGVIKNPPINSHFTFNVLASFSTFFEYDKRLEDLWLEWFVSTYILLKENTDHKVFEEKMDGFIENHLGNQLKANNAELHNTLRPLRNIHLYSKLNGELGENGDIKMIYLLLSIAIGILLIASFNFVNLSTACASQRAKEVGIRKVFGANQFQIAKQFFFETFINIIFALIIASLLAQVLLPYFNFIINRKININFINMPWLSSGIIGSVLFVLIIAGTYPAVFVSKFNPIYALKGNLNVYTKKSLIRSVFVVLQFVISTCLIIFTLNIYNQQKFMQNKDLGFNKENILVVAVQNKEIRGSLESFKNELLSIKGIKSVCASSMVPGEMYLFSNGTYPEGSSKETMFRMQNFLIDYDFINTLDIKIIKGRQFEQEITTDKGNAILINETAARVIEWEDPLGKNIEIINFNNDNKSEVRQVIGVYKDFHHQSLYSKIEPTFVRLVSNEGPIENRARRLSLRLETENFAKITEDIKQKWKEFYPEIPFYYFYLDESFDNQHIKEKSTERIIGSFSFITILIACVGLYGLASFSVERRLKEIVIRKVFGTKIKSIIWLLCKDYLQLVVISNLIAWPLSYYICNQWLRSFPYAVSINYVIFLIAIFFTIIIAFMVVISNSLKAAHKNPVEILKYD